ncbi:glycosyltransferase [Aeromonas salmonicida]|uniref:glycosyltransferase n=1 Tax=Aeromonas salmonicida TaxID=645 RepID=UPI00223F0246|nr:glycosyltransferase [Aeromonas salmonicida]
MHYHPLVTVVIPSYNHAHYIERAINSVYSQTYKNLEVIVVDDGSSDASVELINKLSLEMGFIFIEQSNIGVSKTLNKAIKDYSNGKYICVLASDDYFHPEKIEKQMKEIIKSSDSEFCYTKAMEFDSESGTTIREFPKKIIQGKVLDEILFHQPYAAGTIMFTRSLFDRVGGFDEGLKIEDWDFSIRCAAETSFSVVAEPLFFYRSHKNNTIKKLDRRIVFKNKMQTLTKNYMIASPVRWLYVVLIHFIFDHYLFNFKRAIRSLINR